MSGSRSDWEARACLAVFLLSLPFIVLVGLRDRHGIANGIAEQRECVAAVVADGAPNWLAVRECSARLNVPPDDIDRNLP